MHSRAGESVCLIVDDEPVIRTYLRAILQRQGIQSLEAEDAVSGLRILHKLGGQIDLLVTDIRMPGDIDGVDLAHLAKNSFPALPIILISGYGDQGPADFPFIQKPFLPEKVLAAVNAVMLPPGAQDAAASSGEPSPATPPA